MSRRLTGPQKVARRERRAGVREAASEKVAALRAWREDRAKAAKDRAVQRAADTLRTNRGVDRVPAGLRGLSVTVKPHRYGKRPGVTGKAVRIDSTLGAYRVGRTRHRASHDDRRAMGQRGKPRRVRLREMPGAEARRIERNHKAWSA